MSASALPVVHVPPVTHAAKPALHAHRPRMQLLHLHIRPHMQLLRMHICPRMHLLHLHTHPRMLVRLVCLVPAEAGAGGDHPRPLRLS